MSHQPMGRFLEACGASGPLELEVVDGNDVVVGRWSMPQPFAVIGRDPKADLSFTDEQVSVRHAYLQILEGRVFCVDLGSRAGVTWDGVALPCGWLPPGGSIGIGAYRIRLAGNHRPGPVEPWPSPLAVNRLVGGEKLSKVSLEFPDVTPEPVRWASRRVLTLIGRSNRCQLRIPDEAVSSFQCALLRTRQGVWLVDLLSREGTRMNGALVRWGRLSDGDVLRVSRYRMAVRYEAGSNPSDADLPTLGNPPTTAPAAEIPPLPLHQFPALFPGPSGAMGDPLPSPLRGALAGRPPEQVAAVESALAPLVAEFGQMQRQMFDQFQQAMMMMFQMFGSMHRDQMDLVREELDRIRELNREIQELKAAVEKGAASRPPARPSPRVVPHGPRPVKPAAALGGSAERPSPPPTRPAPAPSLKPSAPGRTPIMDERAENVHDLLFKRMSELQDERQNRWQKLLNMVSGGTGG